MKKSWSIAASMMMLACSPASADYFSAQTDNGSRSFSDRPIANAAQVSRIAGDYVNVPDRSELAGVWTAEADDGRYINFRIESNGKFVFDERNRQTPARLYMCGRIDTTPASLELDVRKRKEMQATGETTEIQNASSMELQVVSAGKDRLVLDVEGVQLVFFRS